MLNTAQNELLQQFLTIPDPTYAQIFDAHAERDELADEVVSLKSDNEGLTDDLQDAEMQADDDLARIRELESALADALVWIAGDVLPSDLAETDKAFRKLYKVL